MRKLLALGVVLVFTWTASASFIEDFDSYADQAAMDAVWGAGQVLDQAKGYSDDQSVTNQPTPVSSISLTLSQGYVGTDANPLKFEIMADVDVLHWWTRDWVRLEERDDAGGLVDLVMLGFNSSGDQTKYHSRGGTGWVWGSIDDLSGNPVFDRNTDWRRLTALIKSTTIEFYVDGVLGRTVATAGGYTYNTVGIGTSYSSQEQVWFDDITVEIIPEPSALGLLALGGLALIRRR